MLPITHKDRFLKLGIRPPKGVLLHGPPGKQRLLEAAGVEGGLPSTRKGVLLHGLHGKQRLLEAAGVEGGPLVAKKVGI